MRRHALACGLLAAVLTARLAAAGTDSYSTADFAHVRKLDAHVHANTADSAFLDVAGSDGFELLSINVDYPDFPPLAAQAHIARTLHAQAPSRFFYATTFSMQNWTRPGWADLVNASLEQAVADGLQAAKRNMRLIRRIGQPPDHPVVVGIPETEYLKGLVLEAMPGR